MLCVPNLISAHKEGVQNNLKSLRCENCISLDIVMTIKFQGQANLLRLKSVFIDNSSQNPWSLCCGGQQSAG